MDPLEELLGQKEKLTARRNEYKAQLAQADNAQDRAALKGKLAAYRSALRDIQVQIDHLDPPEARRTRKERRRRLDVDGLCFDFFQYGGAVWSDLEGRSWSGADGLNFGQVEDGDFAQCGALPEGQLQSWLAEGSRRLTDRQRLYIDAYYNQGLSLESIAQAAGVDKSTVSRVIHNGLDRLKEWVEAKRLLLDCASGGSFDWERYLREGQALTPRQRQLALLVLSGIPKTQGELAEKLGLEQSTVSRTLTAAGQTLRRLETPQGRPEKRPVIHDWAQADHWELARQTGMSLGEYYRLCRGRVRGLTRYRWELYRRMKAGLSVQETARELGLNPKTVRRGWSRLRTQERRGLLNADP